jgi:hypothetical protein
MKTTPWRLHDLRRTAVTGMAELGIRPDVIELAVNHVSGHRGGIAGVYNRSEMLPDRKTALERWASHIEALVSGKGAANVLPMTAKAAEEMMLQRKGVAEQLSRTEAGDRYRAAITELRKALGDSELFERAKAWAIKLCLSAEELDWWNPPRRQRTWDNGASAALKLANHLECCDEGDAFMRVSMAERDSGVQLKSNNGDELCDVAFTKMLKALAEQPNWPNDPTTGWFQYGPLFVYHKKRVNLPSKSMTLAVAMIYGFRRLTGGAETNGGFTGRFDMLVGGKPCYRAAMLFANATFSPKVNAAAIDKWLDRHKRRAKVAALWFSPWFPDQGQ